MAIGCQSSGKRELCNNVRRFGTFQTQGDCSKQTLNRQLTTINKEATQNG